MLIRNVTLQMSATERACMDVRVMNGCVWEMGAALVKGLYEAEIDLHGDVLMPGRMLETPVPAADEKTLRLLCRRLYREGVRYFVADCPAEVKAALEDPEKSHADEMLSAAEKVASEKMTVLVVEPMKEPYVKEIDPDLHSLQAEVGGDIGATYPYSDPVALVCNDEGKLIGLDLNRGLRDENGEIYDIVAGTFLVVGLGEEDFASLSPELIQKYTEQFKTPERFMQINGNIIVLPVPAEKQDLTFLPDRFETGERVQTPRGSFQVTAMSREQMEAAGYGVHHISDDGKYLIMGNGTRAFAVAAEQPEKDNPLRTAEMTLEDDYGMIDGVINNGRRGEELEKIQEYAERTTPEKPSIRERLEDAKRECAEHKPPEGKKPGRDVPEHDCL